MKLKISQTSTLIIAGIIVNICSINLSWSPTQGWYREWAYYATNHVPYKDFYLPFPPLFVWLNQIFQNFSDPLLCERISMVIIWVSLSVGLFKALLRFIPNSNSAFAATLIGTLVFQFSPTNTIAGYYEFALMFLVWGIYWTLSERKGLELLGGIAIASASLTKQNFVVALPVMLFGVIYCTIRRQAHSKKITFAIFGIFLTYFAFGFYLLISHSFRQFISDMLVGGGKSPHLSALVNSVLAPVTEAKTAICFGFAICFACIASLNIPTRKKQFLSSVILALLAYWLLIPSILNNQLWGRFGIMVALAIFLYGISKRRLISNLAATSLIIWILVFVPACTFVLAEILSRKFAWTGKKLLTMGGVADNYVSFFNSAFLAISIMGFILFIRDELSRKYLSKSWEKERNFEFQNDLYSKRVILIFVILAGILNAFNGAFDFVSNLFLGSLGLAYTFQSYFSKIIRLRILGVLCACFLIASISISLHTYSWFGWDENFNGHSQNNIHIFRNFYLTGYETDHYERISKDLKLASDFESQNQNAKLRILVYPMEPIIYDFTNLQQYRVACPIAHFDVCPEKIASTDNFRIAQDPPEVVVLYNLGEQFISANEKSWRGGKLSAYRSTVEFFTHSARYSIIDQISPDNTNLATVTVLALKQEKSLREARIKR